MKRFALLILLAGCGTAPCPCDGVLDTATIVRVSGSMKVLQVNGVDRWEAMAYCNRLNDENGTAASECCRYITFQHYGNDGTRDWETPVGYVGPEPFTPDGDWECKDCWWSAE